MAGIVSKLSKCTPIDSPIRYDIKINHLDELALSDSFSHFIMHQKVTAVKKDDIAYTSPSTAENQKESVNV